MLVGAPYAFELCPAVEGDIPAIVNGEGCMVVGFQKRRFATNTFYVMTTESEDQLFPPIGTVVERSTENEENGDKEEENLLEEVESLCMKCGEQVL